MKRKTRVLIAVPYHAKKRYCLTQLQDSLENIAGYHRSIDYIEIEIVIRQDLNPYGQKDNVKKQREFFRRLALDDEYDYLFFHGADTMPPRDAIHRFVTHNFPVVSGVYWQRGEKKSVNPVAWRKGLSDDNRRQLLDPVTPGDNLIPMDGFGLDCCLIRKDVLEQISWFGWCVNDDDWPFCEAVASNGFPLYIDRRVQCLHWSDESHYSYAGRYFIAPEK